MRSIEAKTGGVGKEKRGAICPGFGEIASTDTFAVCPTSPAHRVRDNGTAAKLAAGFGFRAITSRNVGRNYPGMVGGIIPEWSASPQKQSPGWCDETGAPHVARGVGGLGGQRDSRAIHKQP
jgi:hypothetical protein